MMRVAVLGSGSIGHALAVFLGARPDLRVVIWGRRWRLSGMRNLICFHGDVACFAGRAIAEGEIRRAVQGSDVVIITVPTHARPQILHEIAQDIGSCSFLLSWEGTGPFRESLSEFSIEGPICAGLQRSPIVARLRHRGRSCDLLGIRGSVVAAAIKPGDRKVAQEFLTALLPFNIAVAPSYEYVSVSPGNPLIHPARLFSIAHAAKPDNSGRRTRFYADWNDSASEILLDLHREIKTLRRALRLSDQFVRTLADRTSQPTPQELTAEIRSEVKLSDVAVPMGRSGGRHSFDWDHRFFREDIGEGLSYIVTLAKRAKIPMPTAEAIVDWYTSATIKTGY